MSLCPNTPFHLSCYCSWPVSENQLSPIRTVSLKLMHTVLHPTAETNFSLRIPLLARPVHGITECANGALRSRISLVRPVHRAPSLEDQIKRCAANPNGYEELINYQRQNGFNPLQTLCSKPLQCLSPTLQPQS